MLIDQKRKETGAIFKALRRHKQELRDAGTRYSDTSAIARVLFSKSHEHTQALDEIAQWVRREVEETRKANKYGKPIAYGLIASFIAASSLTGYDIWQHRKDSAALTAKIENLYPYMAEDWDRDDMALLGLPARIECSQVLDGNGGIDIRFSSVRTPVAGSNNGSSTTTNGTLKADGRLEWKITTKELDGTEGNLPGSDKSVRPAAAFCKKALTGAPGVAG